MLVPHPNRDRKSTPYAPGKAGLEASFRWSHAKINDLASVMIRYRVTHRLSRELLVCDLNLELPLAAAKIVLPYLFVCIVFGGE